jgi:hypothetical protein
LMDFFYMGDLIKLVEYFISNNHLPKSIDCSYSYHYNLISIASMINKLSDYEVEVKVKNPVTTKPYIGKGNQLDLEWVGLKQGIKNTYNKLK